MGALHICVFIMCMLGAHGVKKRMSDALELAFKKVVKVACCHVGAGKRIQVFGF